MTPPWGGSPRLVALLPVLLCAHVVSGTVPLPRKALDLGNPAEFEQALKARVSADKQIIMFVFNERSHGATADRLGQMWWLMTMQVIMQLENQGLTHYIALADSAELCQHLHDRWPLSEEQFSPSCAFSSEPYKSHPKGYHQGDIADLWSTRYYIMAKIAETGVDTLLIDTDYEFNHNVWDVLNSPTLAPYHIIGLAEGPLNGGTMFVRGTKAHKHGASLWLLREVERQTSLYRDAEYTDPQHPSDPGRRDDQEILGEALRVASNGPESFEWDLREFYHRGNHDHAFWKEHPQDDARFGPRLQHKWKKTPNLYSADNTSCASLDKAACDRFERFLLLKHFKDEPIEYADICTPHDSPYYDASVPCEKLALGPPWLWVHGDGGQYGWRTPAVHHVLHIEKFWLKQGAGSHSGRLAWLMARKMVDPRLLVLPNRGDLLVQVADEEWQKSFLYNNSAHTKFIIKELVEKAAEEKKVPVFAAIDCSANWLDRSDMTESGILDSRVVETPDGKCYPSPGNYDSCMPNVHFMYDFMLDYYDLKIPYREGVATTWEAEPSARLLEQCLDFTKVLESR